MRELYVGKKKEQTTKKQNSDINKLALTSTIGVTYQLKGTGSSAIL